MANNRIVHFEFALKDWALSDHSLVLVLPLR
jgi:hypothetical protein